ncbi:peroxidase family protein [Thiothrix lacustris]|uniref:Peroxidase family protein n=1 Tax=Thiothrix lacustris TaxID=525917 RepID=A0ABY9MTZ2_9GAMM|nr:peroxidase family protein [Thiothrix lacustris]WML91261.1 peroxidase family protein [Thiothrix lacustris]
MQTIDNNARFSAQRYGQTSSSSSTKTKQTATPQAIGALFQLPDYNGSNSSSNKNPIQNVFNLIQQLISQLSQNCGNTSNTTEYRSIDGSGNNKKHPEWGSANRNDLRKTVPQDSSREPGGSTEQRLPNPRDVSNAVVAQDGNTVNQKGLSDLFWMWGQFLDHDITLTPTSADPADHANIAIPAGDPVFDPNNTGTASLSFERSASTLDANGQNQQTNAITAFIDGSNVYGSDAAYADKLRSHEGGKMLMSAGDMMPMENNQFMAGDVRSNENIGLASMHTLWVREHNRLADELAQQHPKWSDEQVYQEARKTNVAQMQAITYNEFLPELLGDKGLPKYTGYKSNVNPEIDNAFATAAFRLGHTMLSSNLLRLDESGQEIPEGNVALRDAFFRPDKVQEAGIDPILRGAASQTAQAVDPMIVDDVRNFLFGQPGEGGLDLASLNIQRGRDHGLAGYGDAREALGLKPVNSFDSNVWREGFGAKLASVYDSPADVDLWVAGLAEKPVGDSLFGETFTAILSDQFTRLRDGDRFFYQNQFSGQQLKDLNNLKLSDILERNTDFDNVQKNAFVASNIHLSAQPQATTTTATASTTAVTPTTTKNVQQSPVTQSGNSTVKSSLGVNTTRSSMTDLIQQMMQSGKPITTQQIRDLMQSIRNGHIG